MVIARLHDANGRIYHLTADELGTKMINKKKYLQPPRAPYWGVKMKDYCIVLWYTRIEIISQ